MRRVTTSLMAGALALALGLGAACNAEKKPGPKPSGGSGEEGPTEEEGEGPSGGSDAGLGLEQETVELAFRNSADNRQLIYSIDAMVPPWKLDPKNSKESIKIWRSSLDPKQFFSAPSFSLSATCHGSCQAAKLVDNAKTFTQKQLESRPDAVVKKSTGKEAEGIWGFALRSGKNVQFGVTHHHFEKVDYLVYCTGQVPEAQLEAVWKACVDLKMELVDPVVGVERSKKEEENLARCPKESSIKLVANEGQELQEGMVPMDKVDKVVAAATRVGTVFVYLANYDLKTTRWKDAPLTEGQQVLQLQFSAPKVKDEAREVLSGEYAPRHGEEPYLRTNIRVAGGRSFGLGATEGKGEIIARTRDKICGKFDLKDKWRHITGEFVADLVIKAP